MGTPSFLLLAAMNPRYGISTFETALEEANRIGTPASFRNFRNFVLQRFASHGIVDVADPDSSRELDALLESLRLDDPCVMGCPTFHFYESDQIVEALEELGARGVWDFQSFEQSCEIAAERPLSVWDQRERIDNREAIEFLARCYGSMISARANCLEIYAERLRLDVVQEVRQSLAI